MIPFNFGWYIFQKWGKVKKESDLKMVEIRPLWKIWGYNILSIFSRTSFVHYYLEHPCRFDLFVSHLVMILLEPLKNKDLFVVLQFYLITYLNKTEYSNFIFEFQNGFIQNVTKWKLLIILPCVTPVSFLSLTPSSMFHS